MRSVVLRYGIVLGLVVALGLGWHGSLLPAPEALAQESDQCVQIISQALAAAGESCGEVGRGQACYGFAGVSATAAGGQITGFAAGGDTVAIADLEALATTAANPASGEWGMAVLKLAAGLPEEGGQAVTAVLFGDAQMARPVQVQSDRPTLTVTNSGGAPINLRNGAGVVFEVVAQMEPGATAVADGRNEQADWVRIQTEEGKIAWVFTPLITWDGDLQTLQVLLPTDVTPALQPSSEPFQFFTLTTGSQPSLCSGAPSGLLLQYSGEAKASLQINQVNLEFSDATLFVQAVPNDVLEVKVLAGSGTVTARGIAQDAAVTDTIQVNLSGEDGLTPNTPPVPVGTYAFSNVVGIPLSLLPGTLPCVVGLPVDSGLVQLRVGPGEQRGQLGTVNPNISYTVLGWANDPDGNPWWQLDTGTQPSWVAQAQVDTLGACELVAEVEAPPVVIAPVAPGVPAGDGGQVSTGGADFAPTANSVWQMYPGTDNMIGSCTGAPPINFCDHLAAIAPAQGGISWRGMEPTPYFLAQIQPNVYSYSGPNALGTGTITMTLRFTDQSSLTMTQSLTLKSEPNCQHVYYYTGTRNW